MADDHLTVLTPCETETTIKKSRFISRVYHVEDEAEAEAILAAVRKEHYKATHACSAYILATTPLRQKASDDGEPSGTAGKPILEVIARRELKNVLVVVIRYFGGVKLGAGGLIRAYSGGAADVLDAAQIVRKQWSDCLSVTVDYHLYGGLKNDLTDRGILPVNETFTDQVTLDFEVPVAGTESLIAYFRDATNDRFAYEVTGQKQVDLLLPSR